ncbi:TetR/AcrR family transcriptional regulator [Sulfobacillus sp. hq2]|uniref:TetR/AcrR family transcriptional regulator n=1 Tax=Sulfobacillus sp. hq2 TaxID=2039167 RepID=UPI000CD1B0A0|nr:TetR/AcrR family transcriptional regulator [Sulfobacillus sp. hq2]POB09564.1 hypothetical protein CO251_15230 [Sulfobacillus sp. hq2]
MAPGSRPLGRPKAVPEGQTQERILSTAAQLFMELGYDGVSIADVATQAGITKAAIYYYFSTKTELFVAALVQLLTIIRQQTAKILHEPVSLRERLMRLTLTRLQVAQTRLDFNQVLSEALPALTAKQQQELHACMDDLAQVLVQAFDNAQELGEINADHTPEFLAHAYLALLSLAYAKDRDGQPLYPTEDIPAKIISLLWMGIASISH